MSYTTNVKSFYKTVTRKHIGINFYMSIHLLYKKMYTSLYIS